MSKGIDPELMSRTVDVVKRLTNEILTDFERANPSEHVASKLKEARDLVDKLEKMSPQVKDLYVTCMTPTTGKVTDLFNNQYDIKTTHRGTRILPGVKDSPLTICNFVRFNRPESSSYLPVGDKVELLSINEVGEPKIIPGIKTVDGIRPQSHISQTLPIYGWRLLGERT